MNKKKLVFVTLSYAGGGAEKIFTRLIENFYKDFDIVVVTFTNEGIYYERIQKLEIKQYTLKGKINNTIFYALRLKKILKKEKPYKIISFLYYPNIVVFLSNLFKNFNYILCERSNHRYYLKKNIKHKIWKIILRKAYLNADYIVVVSNKIKSYISKDFHIKEDKIKVIYNGINFEYLNKLSFENYSFQNKSLNILAVGRISEAKNYPLLINSFSLLAKKYPNLYLNIIGDGELKNIISNLIKEKKLENRVTLWGFIKNPYPFMKKADCFVLSSKWEGFPNVLIEALYLNGHVVSTDCDTGPSEIITHEHDGLLSPVDDAEKLAENIERMLFDEELRRKVYENSRISVKRFDEKVMIENYKKILE